MKKNKINKIVGLIMMCINALLVFDSLYYLYWYNFTSGLFGVRTPDSVLLATALLGIIGIYKSILLYKGKFGMIPFLIATFAIWLIVFVYYDGWLIFKIVKLQPAVIQHLTLSASPVHGAIL